MEFADFVNNFKDVLREALCEFCKKHGLEYDYHYTIEDEDLVTFEVDLWYDRELWKKFYIMCIDFTLKNEEKDTVIETKLCIDYILEREDEEIIEFKYRVNVITIDKTSEKVDELKDTIIRVMEDLLERELEELKKRLAHMKLYYMIKDLIDGYNWHESWYGFYIEIGRSEVEICVEYINKELHLEKINIIFEKKEEGAIFADFVENSIGVDKTKIEVDPLGIVSINLESFKPEERLDIVRKVIEALEMMYLF